MPVTTTVNWGAFGHVPRCDHDFAGQRLFAFLDPDLQVHVGGPKGNVVAAHTLHHALADDEAGRHVLHQDVERILVDEVSCRGDDVERLPREVQHFLQGAGRGDAGKVFLTRVV